MTSDIGLREYRAGDLDTLKSLAGQESIRMSGVLPRDATEAAWTAFIAARHANRHRIYVVLQDDRAVGFLTLAATGIPEIFQIGYGIDEAVRNRGLATGAIRTCIPPLFAATRCKRLQALVEPSNGPSCRVLEKCGFEKEGLLRRGTTVHGRLADVYMYAILEA